MFDKDKIIRDPKEEKKNEEQSDLHQQSNLQSKMQILFDHMDSSGTDKNSNNSLMSLNSSGKSLVRKQSLQLIHTHSDCNGPIVDVNSNAIDEAQGILSRKSSEEELIVVDEKDHVCQPLVSRMRNEDLEALGIIKMPYSDDGSEKDDENNSVFATPQIRPLGRDERIQQITKRLGLSGMVKADGGKFKDTFQVGNPLKYLIQDQEDEQPWYDNLNEQQIKDLFTGRLDRTSDSYTMKHYQNLNLQALYAEPEDIEMDKINKRNQRRDRMNSLECYGKKTPVQLPRKHSLDLDVLTEQIQDKKIDFNNGQTQNEKLREFANHPLFQTNEQTLKQQIDKKLRHNVFNSLMDNDSQRLKVLGLQKNLLASYNFAQNKMEHQSKNAIDIILKFATDFIHSFFGEQELSLEVQKLLEPQQKDQGFDSDYYNDESSNLEYLQEFQKLGQKRQHHKTKRAKLKETDSFKTQKQPNGHLSFSAQSIGSSLQGNFAKMGIGNSDNLSESINNMSFSSTFEQKRQKKVKHTINSKQLIQTAVSLLPNMRGTREQIMQQAHALSTVEQQVDQSCMKTLDQAFSKHLVSLPATVSLNTLTFQEFFDKKNKRNDESETLTLWIVKLLQKSNYDVSIEQIKREYIHDKFLGISMVNNQDEKIKHEKRVNMNINRHPNLFIKNPKIYGLNCTEHFDGVINQQS